jgi:DNA mismatch endonuclease (patch repair protein)
MDTVSSAVRSQIMAQVRGRANQSTEIRLIRVFRLNKITGWRRQVVIQFPVAGKRFRVVPDFVFPKLKLAVFVDGCFWHGCRWHGAQPANNRAFWQKKLAANKARDRLVTQLLRRRGWRVVRIWEHALGDVQRATKHFRFMISD